MDSNTFISQVSSHQDTLGSDGLRRQRSKLAGALRNATQGIAKAAATSNIVKQMKNAIGAAATMSSRGDTASVFGSGSTSGTSQVGTLNNPAENNRQQKNVNVMVAKSIADAIETAVGKSGEYIDRMRKLAIQYKEEIAKAEQKVIGATPPDQFKISIALNTKLESIVGKIAPLYAAYYAIGPMINEQYSTMSRLYASANGLPPQIPGLAQIPGVGGTPPGFPTAFSSNPPTLPIRAPGSSVFGTSSSSSAFLRRFNIGTLVSALIGIPEAVADSQIEEEKSWAAEWQKFVGEYAAYAEMKDEKLAEQSRIATKLWQKTLNEKQTLELSAEQIEANQIYADALKSETEMLLKQFVAADGDPSKATEFEILKDLKGTMASAKELQENLDRSNRNFLKNYPVTPDDHLTGWKKTLTTLLLESGK